MFIPIGIIFFFTKYTIPLECFYLSSATLGASISFSGGLIYN